MIRKQKTIQSPISLPITVEITRRSALKTGWSIGPWKQRQHNSNATKLHGWKSWTSLCKRFTNLHITDACPDACPVILRTVHMILLSGTFRLPMISPRSFFPIIKIFIAFTWESELACLPRSHLNFPIWTRHPEFWILVLPFNF